MAGADKLRGAMEAFGARCHASSLDMVCSWGEKAPYHILDESFVLARAQDGHRASGFVSLLFGDLCVGESRKAKLVRLASRSRVLAEDVQAQCPICLDGLCSGQTVWTLKCIHQVHEACMLSYLSHKKRSATCPLCRCDIKTIA